MKITNDDLLAIKCKRLEKLMGAWVLIGIAMALAFAVLGELCK